MFGRSTGECAGFVCEVKVLGFRQKLTGKVGRSRRERREVYQPLRHELRQSRWEHVLGVLEELGGQLLCDPTKRESFDKELRYTTTN